MDWRPLINSSVLVTAVVFAILLRIAIFAGLFGIWLLVLLIPALWRYAYGVLRHLAQGRPEIPPPDIESLNPISDLVLIAHFVAFPAVVVLIMQRIPFGAGAPGYLLGLALGALIVVAFPASAALMGLTSNLAAAMNPIAIKSTIRTFGRDYAILVAACLGLILLSAVIEGFVVPNFGFLSGLLGFVVEIWTFLAVFALIGSSIHAHRDDFAIPGIRISQEEWHNAEREKEWRVTLDLAYASIRSGLVAEGYRTLKQFVAENGNSAEVQYWLFGRMLEWDDREHALRIAARLIEQLAAAGDAEAALDLYRRCRQISPDFPVRADAARVLAAYAREIGHLGIADELSSDLGARPPRGL